MPQAPHSNRLLRLARRRLYFARLLEGGCRALLLAAVTSVFVVTAQKLTGLWATQTTWILLAALPATFAALALALTQRPDLIDAARRIDAAYGTHDLFLNLVTLDRSVGAYQPLVVALAEQTVLQVDLRRAIPILVPPRLWRALLLLAVSVAVALAPVQLDPFGNVARAAAEKKQQEQVLQTLRDTQARARELKKKLAEKDGEVSPEVQRAIDQLKQSLKAATPKQRNKNEAVLDERQREIGEQWRELMRREAARFMAKNDPAQQFGGKDAEKLRKLTDQLRNGDPSGLQKELDQIKSELERLAKQTDPVKRSEQLQRLKKRLKQLERLASRSLQSKPLSAALQKALQQLDAARLEKLSDLARQAALESLDLAKLELENIAQTARDLKKLEEALQVLAAARRCNASGRLDGSQCENCITLADYAELYRMLTGKAGNGLGDPNGGGGDKEPEDDSVDTDFKTEVDKAAIRAGKILLSIKTQGLSDPGEARQAYRQQLQMVKQSASEAIELEDIPPGYRERVKRYFDSLDETALDLPKAADSTDRDAAPAP